MNTMSIKTILIAVSSVVLLCTFGPLQAQTTTIVEAPAGYDAAWGGINSPSFATPNAVYWAINDASGVVHLSRIEGDSLTVLQSPVNTSPQTGINKHAAVGGKHFVLGTNAASSTVMLELVGDSLVEVPNPVGYTSSGQGLFKILREQGDSVFVSLIQGSKRVPAIFDGTSYSILPLPSVFLPATGRIRDFAFESNGILHFTASHGGTYSRLIKYSGGAFTEVPMPTGFTFGAGIGRYEFELNGNYYFYAEHDTGYRYLMEYDGTTLTVVPSPAGYDQAQKGFFKLIGVIGNSAYLSYHHNSGEHVLVEFDGTTLTETFPAVAGEQFWDGVSAGNQLFLTYVDAGGRSILKLHDGTTLSDVATPTGFTSSGGYSRYIGGTGNAHLVQYSTGGVNGLFRLDGTSLTAIPFTGYEFNSTGFELINQLYFPVLNASEIGELKRFDGTAVHDVPLPADYASVMWTGWWGLHLVADKVLYGRVIGSDTSADVVVFEPCPKPGNRTSHSVTDSTAVASWVPVSAANMYKFRWKQPGTTGWNSTILPATADSLSLTGLALNTPYNWTIQSRCNSGWGALSKRTVFRTTNGPCDAPANISANPVLVDKAHISWTNAAGAVKTRMRWRMLGDTVWSIHTFDTSRTHWWITGLDTATTYEWQLLSVCQFGPNNPGVWTASQTFGTPSAKHSAANATAMQAVASSLRMYPNPTGGPFTISGLEALEGASLNLLDATGRVLEAQQITGQNRVQWQLDRLPAGMYLLRIEHETGVINKKLIIR